MAHTMENAVNRQLLFDLQKTFPDVPHQIVVATLQTYRNNRDVCFDVLREENRKYVYGPYESAVQFHGLHLRDERPRGYSQPSQEPRPPEPVFSAEQTYSRGMTHSRSEPHLLQETSNSPTHLGRPPETSGPAYYTDYAYAMRQFPGPPPPAVPYSTTGQMNFSQDARFQYAQQPQQLYSTSMMPTGYNSNGANYNYATTGASNASNAGMKQEWTSPVSTRGDSQRSSSPYVNYATSGSPYTSGRQEGNQWPENRTNFTHATSQPNLRPLFIDTSPHPTRQLLNTMNPSFASHSPHNSRSQSPVVHNPLQTDLSHRGLPPPAYQSGVPNHQGAQTPGSEPGTPPVYFPPNNSNPNVFFQQMPPTHLLPVSSEQSLLTSSDPQEKFVHQQPIQPAVLSPSSSISSLNEIEGRQSRSNSTHTDDIAYTQALILHQKARKEKLEKEAERYRAFRDQLRTEVWAMETEVTKRKSCRNKDQRSVTPDDLVSLRESNRRLQVDVQLLYREVDSYESGHMQPPVNENFYSNMNSTGQEGTLRPPPIGVIESLQSVPRPPIRPVDPAEQNPSDEEQWACTACTFLNHPALDKCECCEFPRGMPHSQGPGLQHR